MDTEAMHHISKTEKRAGLRWPQIAIIIFVTIAATAGLTYWLLDHYLFVKKFEPVELRPMEEQALNSKLRVIGIDVPQAGTDGPPLEPEPYSEAGARREIAFTEREVNAMVARNTDLAQKLAIDLSDDLVSATMLVPMDDSVDLAGF
jgi:flagellar basal body-associated protein FliL